jgi:oxygen-dependent protoporphyrinogen oxidase
MTGKPRIIVVGAGIAGLSAAFRLEQAGCDVIVLERSGPELIGGRMSTLERHGFHVDVGATLLPSSYREMIKLIVDAGLTGEVRPASNLAGIVRDGAVHRVETGSAMAMLRSPLIRSFPVTDLLKVGFDYLRTRSRVGWDDMSRAAVGDFESVCGYAMRRGLRADTLEYLLAPLVTAPTMDDPEHGSIIAAFACFKIVLASGAGFTSPRGVCFLPQGLARKLTVVHHAEVTSVEEHGDGVTVTWTQPGEAEHSEAVAACVLAVPLPQALAVYDQFLPEQREFLQNARYSRSVHVAFGLERATAESSVTIFVPRIEHPDIIAYILEHNQAPDRVPAGTGLVMAHFGGTWSAANWELDDSKVVDHAFEITRRLGVLPELESHTTMTEVLRVSPCIISRRPGEYRAIARFARTLRTDSPVQLAGGDYLAHSSTNASVCSGEKAARRILAQLRHPAMPTSPAAADAV